MRVQEVLTTIKIYTRLKRNFFPFSCVCIHELIFKFWKPRELKKVNLIGEKSVFKKGLWKKVGKCIVSLSLSMAFVLPSGVNNADAVSSSTSYVLLYLDKKEAYINNELVMLDVAATSIDGSTYLPLKFMSDTLEFQLTWDATTNQYVMTNQDHYIIFDQKQNYILADGEIIPFDSVASIVDNRLLVKMTWLADLAGAKYRYNEELKKVELFHVNMPHSSYDEVTENALPVAKFTTDKSFYKIGEPVQYFDFSYDPDGDAIAYYDWEGNEPVFFESGTHEISLKVTDRHGNESIEFKRTIEVSDVVHLSEEEYPLYHQQPGSLIQVTGGQKDLFQILPEISNEREVDVSRKILISDSPESISEYGVLYRDSLSGKARLYANHVNVMDEQLQFYILARNVTDSDVEFKITNKGEAIPSLYAQLFGQQAALDFLLQNKSNPSINIPAGEIAVVAQMPIVYPKQGFNLMYDVQSDGELEYIFVAMKPGDDMSDLDDYDELEYDRHIRGTFIGSEINMNLDLGAITGAQRLTIADGVEDAFLQGYDPLRGEQTTLTGNYGITYHIKLKFPGAMAVLLVPRGGSYKGPVVVNGVPQMVPRSGVLSITDGAQLIARTEGNETELNIDLIPAAGSSLPFSLIFYPLDKTKL